MAEWWLSSRRMTIWARDRGGIVVATAPIARWAVGKPLAALVGWVRGMGPGFAWARIGDDLE